MKLKLPSSLYSLQDLTALIIELRDFRRQLTHVTIQSKTSKARHDMPVLSPAAQQLVDQTVGHHDVSRTVLDELIVELEKIRTSARHITITLAAPATSLIKERLAEWCRAQLAADILVNFSFNANLLGGMVVSYNSHIYDWSWRREIMAKRATFPEVLRRV